MLFLIRFLSFFSAGPTAFHPRHSTRTICIPVLFRRSCSWDADLPHMRTHVRGTGGLHRELHQVQRIPMVIHSQGLHIVILALGMREPRIPVPNKGSNTAAHVYTCCSEAQSQSPHTKLPPAPAVQEQRSHKQRVKGRMWLKRRVC